MRYAYTEGDRGMTKLSITFSRSGFRLSCRSDMLAQNTSAAEDVAETDIIYGFVAPDPLAYKLGWGAHAAGKGFHEGPKQPRAYALSWRIGWNNRALQTH
jgi:hypothetical protein